jgi:N-acetyl-gamma-glutamyl-phosphate reductase
VTGYTGMELARLLCGHPVLRLSVATSRAEAGKSLSGLYPFLRGFPEGDLELAPTEPGLIAERCDLAFLAVPHGTAMNLAAELRGRGVKVVDLSADFRLRSGALYEEWYKRKHSCPEFLDEAVYGLPELYAEEIGRAGLVANPGCYPTASVLGLYPALKHGLLETGDIIIDAKSGTSGAGRKAGADCLFCEVSDSFRAYGLPGHRHIPEIEQELSRLAGTGVQVSFTPHLLPVNRGILATIYARPAAGVKEEDLRAAYAREYAGHGFVRVLPEGALPELRNVRGSMFCDIGLAPDRRTGRLVILSVIDNLCRGASGQAVANANLMCGLPLASGLAFAPLAP